MMPPFETKGTKLTLPTILAKKLLWYCHFCDDNTWHTHSRFSSPFCNFFTCRTASLWSGMFGWMFVCHKLIRNQKYKMQKWRHSTSASTEPCGFLDFDYLRIFFFQFFFSIFFFRFVFANARSSFPTARSWFYVLATFLCYARDGLRTSVLVLIRCAHGIVPVSIKKNLYILGMSSSNSDHSLLSDH